MTLSFSEKCQKSLLKIKKKDKILFHKIEKKLALFEKNPQSKSLRLHKLSGSQSDVWSISIDMSYRMLFYYHQADTSTKAVFFCVGTHDEVYE